MDLSRGAAPRALDAAIETLRVGDDVALVALLTSIDAPAVEAIVAECLRSAHWWLLRRLLSVLDGRGLPFLVRLVAESRSGPLVRLAVDSGAPLVPSRAPHLRHDTPLGFALAQPLGAFQSVVQQLLARGASLTAPPFVSGPSWAPNTLVGNALYGILRCTHMKGFQNCLHVLQLVVGYAGRRMPDGHRLVFEDVVLRTFAEELARDERLEELDELLAAEKEERSEGDERREGGGGGGDGGGGRDWSPMRRRTPQPRGVRIHEDEDDDDLLIPVEIRRRAADRAATRAVERSRRERTEPRGGERVSDTELVASTSPDVAEHPSAPSSSFFFSSSSSSSSSSSPSSSSSSSSSTTLSLALLRRLLPADLSTLPRPREHHIRSDSVEFAWSVLRDPYGQRGAWWMARPTPEWRRRRQLVLWRRSGRPAGRVRGLVVRESGGNERRRERDSSANEDAREVRARPTERGDPPDFG